MTAPVARASGRGALEPIVVVFAAFYVVVFVTVAIMRARHPFELEWMEGGVLAHVERIREGKAIYAAPTLEFVPFIYTPLYYHVAALFSRVLGTTFLALRVTSILATLGCMGVLFAYVKRETRSWLPPIVSVGLFAAGYRRGAEFLDLARVDALFLLFLLGALAMTRHARSRRHQVLAGVLFTLAFFTKQSALIVALAMAVPVVSLERRRAWPFVGTMVVGIGGGALLLDVASDGWFRYYAFELPRQHAIERVMFLEYWSGDLAPWAIAFAALLYLLLGAPTTIDGEARRYYLFGTLGMLGTAWSSRLHTGGFHNVLLPAIAWLSLVAGVGLHAARVAVAATGDARRSGLTRFVLAAAFAQLACHLYDPRQLVPKKRDVLAGLRLVETLRGYQGEVFVPSHGYLAVMAGKRSFAHLMAVEDVLRVDDDVSTELRISIADAIRAQRFSAVVQDEDEWFQDVMTGPYRRDAPAVPDEAAFHCVSGIRVRPEKIWVPQREPPS
ncbi:MAG: glycosyltransferase family 39 protein [Polyangiales bacterium]